MCYKVVLLIFISIGLLSCSSQRLPTPIAAKQQVPEHIPTYKIDQVMFEVSEKVSKDCYNKARQIIPWKDPYSVKFVSATRYGFEIYNNGILQDRNIYIAVNAKNSYGGYTGPEQVTCSLVGDKVVNARIPGQEFRPISSYINTMELLEKADEILKTRR